MIQPGIHPSAIIDCQGTCQLPESTILEPGTVIYVGSQGRLTLGERNILYPNVSLRIDQGWLSTGDEVSFGPGCQLYEPRAGIEIGNHCLIAGGVILCGVRHGLGNTSQPMRHQPAEAQPIRLGDDVWIGMGAVIAPGVHIGSGAVIGAGSIVTRDIPDNSIAWGNPCRVRRQRQGAAGLDLTAHSPVRLHLGCGQRFIPGFLHIDAQPYPHLDLVCDVAKLDAIPDASADLVYASHVLEHFGRWEFRATLTEWRRILKPGGILRLAVPDFAACAKLYYKPGLADGLTGLIGLIVGGQRDGMDDHRMVFDEPFLRQELLGLGFRNIRH